MFLREIYLVGTVESVKVIRVLSMQPVDHEPTLAYCHLLVTLLEAGL